jgi:FkbM family methyltransferase
MSVAPRMLICQVDLGLRLPLEFECRADVSDYNTVNACAQEDEYGVADIDVQDKIVFDIGSHIGGFGIWNAARGAKVVCVEPVPENVELIRRNVRRNATRIPKTVHVVEAAIGEAGGMWIEYGWVGDENAEVHAYIGNTGLGLEGFSATRKIWVETRTLQDLVDQYGAPDIIKVDCEGGEWEMLKEDCIHDVPLITGEWHDRAHGYLGSGGWVETQSGYKQKDVLDLLPNHAVTFTGPDNAAGGFRAVLTQQGRERAKWRDPGYQDFLSSYGE